MRITVWTAALVSSLALWGAARAEAVGVMDNPCAAVAALPAPQRQAADFGGLCRYEAENAALPAASGRRVILYGDSITELWKQKDPGFFSGDVLDRGVSGQTTSQMLLRFQQDVVDLHPRLVQIMAGTNDIAGNTGPTSIARIEANIRSMVELAKAHHIKLLLASIPPAARFAWSPGVDSITPIQTLNAWLRHYAVEQGQTYVDYDAVLDDSHHGFKSAWTPDGVHPNKDGYAAMDPLARRAIDEALRAGR